MKEFDFLPEWYKEDRRRHLHVRRQYLALVAVFLVMMILNTTALRRVDKAAAQVVGLENQRAGAEAVIREFDGLTKRLNELKGRANLVEEMDSRVDIAAILAEMSHIVSDSIVLRKVEIQAEPFARTEEREQTKGSVVRLGGKTANSGKEERLGAVKFRIVLTGVAAHPADVPDLVCKLDASQYFQRVHLSFYGSAKAQTGAKATPRVPGGQAVPGVQGDLDVTEFEIVCYLANYQETQE